MSRKTKEEKKIAAYRKRLQLLQQISQIKNAPGLKQDIEPITNLKSAEKQIGVKNTFFIKDLKKSIFIILVIITLEFIIYFATIKDYLKLVF